MDDTQNRQTQNENPQQQSPEPVPFPTQYTEGMPGVQLPKAYPTNFNIGNSETVRSPSISSTGSQFKIKISPNIIIIWGLFGLIISQVFISYNQIMLDEPNTEDFQSLSDYNDAVNLYNDNLRVNQAIGDILLGIPIIMLVGGLLFVAIQKNHKSDQDLSISLRVVILIASLYMLAGYIGLELPFTSGLFNITNF